MAAEGALARREVLEAQIKRAREQVKQLLAKSDDDDSLIRTLHSRLTAQGNRCVKQCHCFCSTLCHTYNNEDLFYLIFRAMTRIFVVLARPCSLGHNIHIVPVLACCTPNCVGQKVCTAFTLCSCYSFAMTGKYVAMDRTSLIRSVLSMRFTQVLFLAGV